VPLYLIAFNDEWVPELTPDDIDKASRGARAVIAEMTDAGVFVFSDGALDASTVVCSVEPHGDEPIFSDGPYV
jgi:hypothetical protein